MTAEAYVVGYLTNATLPRLGFTELVSGAGWLVRRCAGLQARGSLIVCVCVMCVMAYTAGGSHMSTKVSKKKRFQKTLSLLKLLGQSLVSIATDHFTLYRYNIYTVYFRKS